MNVEDLVRSGLRDAADQVAPIPGLSETSIERGRHRRVVRRLTTAGGVVLSVAAIAATGVVVANNTGGSAHHKLGPATQGPGTQQVIADPWWDTWTTDRYFGHVDPAFLEAARPTYDRAAGPDKITIYAAGTNPDGMQWAMFTDPREGHVMQWLEGVNNAPDYGESSGQVTPDITWTSWTVPTQASQNTAHVEEWLIVVGKPGTTAIDYSPDGTTWQSINVDNGIGVMKVTTDTGFPPAAAKVRLSDAGGVYATGTPAGAGANANPSDSPTPGPGDASPTATPSVGPVSTTVPASAAAKPTSAGGR